MRIPSLILVMSLALSGCDAAPQGGRQSGIDRSGMDLAVRPGDDFFAYANGTWLKTTEIPADQAAWGSFTILQDQNLERLHAIAEQAKGARSGDRARVGALYAAFMDEQRIATRGLDPLATELAAIAALGDHDAIAAYFGHASLIGVGSPLGLWVDQDARDATRYILHVEQGGLGLPDRDYYFDTSENGRAILAKYREFIVQLLALAKHPDPATAADRIVALETRLAGAHWTRLDNRDAEKTYNRHDTAQLRQLLGNFPLDGLLSAQRIATPDAVIVRQPSFAAAVARLFREVSPDWWRDYLQLRLLSAYAPYLPPAFEQLHFDFYQRTLNGQAEPRERWKRAIEVLNAQAGELLGKLYVEKHFPPAAKARMETLVGNLLEAYRISISQLDWMGPKTRARALEKLERFTAKIGYPRRWRDYAGLRLAGDDLIGNLFAIQAFNHDYEIGKLGRPVDRDEWFMPPQQINAYYNAGLNEIVFPAGILQPPFFNLNADEAVNYGAIGAVIGHEIGHGFDDQGSKYSGDGNLHNWWTERDRERFEQRTRALIAQYDQYEALPGRKVNGALSLGENIGDLGGLGIAFSAYRMSLGGKDDPVIDGFSGEQRVFLGWAQAWRMKRRDALAERMLRVAPHSPPQFRVNGVVRNIDAFYRAFEVGPDERLYLPPQERVKIW
ncbi:MAG TPA: M13-type metalloendopeptidase [Porticoccaceae bacterium]|nr:M13-type metalloendopeptidase [Porticoccaceae bacterium]